MKKTLEEEDNKRKGSVVLERMTGIEPALSAWKADVLPLDDIRRVWGMGAPTCKPKGGRLSVFLSTDTIITDLEFPTTASLLIMRCREKPLFQQ